MEGNLLFQYIFSDMCEYSFITMYKIVQEGLNFWGKRFIVNTTAVVRIYRSCKRCQASCQSKGVLIYEFPNSGTWLRNNEDNERSSPIDLKSRPEGGERNGADWFVSHENDRRSHRKTTRPGQLGWVRFTDRSERVLLFSRQNNGALHWLDEKEEWRKRDVSITKRTVES